MPHAALVVLADVVVLIVWASVGGPFWPKWVLAATTLTISLHAWLLRAPSALARVAGVAVFLEAFQIALWAFGGGGYFWPVWTALGFGARSRGRRGRRCAAARLEQRIEVLETTRAGAVDVQETDLRRIERDLHDGAQARLVALGMNLGLAEQKLAADPEAARDLVAEARVGVEAGAARAARPRARHAPAGAHRPRARRGGRVARARERDPGRRRRGRPRAAAGGGRDGGVLRRRRGDGERREARRRDADHGAGRRERRLDSCVEVADDGRGGADLGGSGLVGPAASRRGARRDARRRRARPAAGRSLRAELPCAS